MSDQFDFKNNSGCGVGIGLVVLVGIGLLCNHASEEAEKLDTITNVFIGTLILGLVFLCIFLYSKNK